jgi:hypothetical protein
MFYSTIKDISNNRYLCSTINIWFILQLRADLAVNIFFTQHKALSIDLIAQKCKLVSTIDVYVLVYS